ncbi:hypothetical protein [Sphingomonas sp.]|uniref:hypothetical protein n=1 Tax=Sphingomonas sp. TaxID=28214 RepID=UPI0025DE750D|nr:hypothetical protein [Sphingomonas sp.]
MTVTLPFGFERASGSSRCDLADAKYRFYKDEKQHRSVAIFPRVILPTGRKSMTTGRTR